VNAPLLSFPTDYPIKVIGRPTAEFSPPASTPFVLRHVPALEASPRHRALEQERQLSVDFLRHPRAEPRSRLTALAADLTACEGVLLVI